MTASVLIAASDARTRSVLVETLASRGHAVHAAATSHEARALQSEHQPELALLVLPLIDAPADRAAHELLTQNPGLYLVLAGKDALVKDAAAATRLGARRYLRDPLGEPAELLGCIGQARGSHRSDRRLKAVRASGSEGLDWERVVGRAPAFQRVIDTLRKVCARTWSGATPTVLLGGPTGSGKGYVARCLHANSARAGHPFVDINCAALPPSLIESELFGYEHGAFTDAKGSRPGLFEAAAGGTLFLDEIGALPVDLQTKLLTAIEDKAVRRVGGRTTRHVDVLIIAATHEDLRSRVAGGSFRADLYHRLNVVSVTLPSLRERGDDVLALAEAFVREVCCEYRLPMRELSDDAKQWMLEHPWPGNVRELRNRIERIIVLGNEDVIRAEHLEASNDEDSTITVANDTGDFELRFPATGVSFDQLERELLRQALLRCRGNVTRAARLLSLSRQTFMYRMKKHGLDPRAEKAAAQRSRH